MTPIFDARRKPIPLPDLPRISREDSELLFRADITMAAWLGMTDQERANIRWNTPATNAFSHELRAALTSALGDE